MSGSFVVFRIVTFRISWANKWHMHARCRTAEHRISSTRVPAASCRTLLRDKYLSLTFANQEVDIIKPTRCRASLYKNQIKDQFPTDSFRLKRLDQIHLDKKILKTFESKLSAGKTLRLLISRGIPSRAHSRYEHTFRSC